jgi:hypothetical protein
MNCTKQSLVIENWGFVAAPCTTCAPLPYLAFQHNCYVNVYSKYDIKKNGAAYKVIEGALGYQNFFVVDPDATYETVLTLKFADGSELVADPTVAHVPALSADVPVVTAVTTFSPKKGKGK